MLTFSQNTIGALEFTIHWENDGVIHEERFLGRKFNAVNDIFPRGMRDALEGKKEGESVAFTYEPRMCIPRFKENLVITLGLDRLRKKTIDGRPIIPKVGRFYPQGHINGLVDIYPDTLTPFRMVELTDETFTADRNHPLANMTVTIEARIQYLEKLDSGTFGSLTHWREKTCDWGPGMQTRLNNTPTDFFLPSFFDQHTPDNPVPNPPSVYGKAMDNFKAVAANHLKKAKRIHDFSHSSKPDGEFDGAQCFHAIEYMTDPISSLKEIAAHLAQGAPVVIGFSNKYDQSKAIQGWQEIHEFERMGLVLEYLRQAGLDENAGTVSIRNDWRPKDDPLFLETRGVSDPIYIVYGHKK